MLKQRITSKCQKSMATAVSIMFCYFATQGGNICLLIYCKSFYRCRVIVFFCFQNNISKQHLPKVPKLLIRQVSNNSALVFCKKLLAEENSCCCVSITRLVKSHLLLTYRGAFLWRNLGEICHFLTETFFWHAIGDFDKNIPVTLAQSREQLSTG